MKGYTFEFGSDPARIKLYLAHRLELNSDLKAIDPAKQLYPKLLNCQATSCTVERSSSMLDKLLAKDCHFSANNVCKYLELHVDKSLE